MKLLKKMLIPMLLLTLIISMVPSVSATYDRVYEAPHGTPAAIDGVIDPVWNKAEWTLVDKPWDGINESDAVVKVKLLWDEGFLYFLCEIYDSSFNKDLDMLDIYLDQTCTRTPFYGSDDSQTRFKLAGETVKGAPQVAGKNAQQNALVCVTSSGKNEYIMEGALYHVAGTPEAGTVYGLEFLYSDFMEGNNYDGREYYRWNIDQPGGDKAAWESTEHWGTLILADENGGIPADPPPIIHTPADTSETTVAVTTMRPPINTIPRETTAPNTTPIETTDVSSTDETYEHNGNYCGGMPDRPKNMAPTTSAQRITSPIPSPTTLSTTLTSATVRALLSL